MMKVERLLAWSRQCRRQAAVCAGTAVLACLPVAVATAGCWPLWDRFGQQFIQADGRVIDHSVPQLHTTSEGQSYAMFFALVAQDEARFRQLWQWSVDNLFLGQPDQRLPAWQWGRKDDGTWGVIDDNSASDADLWFAYALLEAATAWKQPDYQTAADTLLAQIIAREVVDLPGLGKMLLPGERGFVEDDRRWRLNPSYLPVQLLLALARHQPDGPWQEIADNTITLLHNTASKGVVADWIAYEWDGEQGRFTADPVKGPIGSYDAIRTYTWAGMLPNRQGRPLLNTLSGMARLTRESTEQFPPESVNIETGVATETGPVGFSAALLPYFSQRRERMLYAVQKKRVLAALKPDENAEAPGGLTYYDLVLSLFGMGWDEQRYRFKMDGTLLLNPEKTC